MPPVGVVPVVVVVVVAILIEPLRVHHGPFRMMPVEPHDLMLMPPSCALPGATIVVSAPSSFSGSAVVARAVVAGTGTVLREGRRCHSKRENHAGQGNRLFQLVFEIDFHRRQYRRRDVSRRPPQALAMTI